MQASGLCLQEHTGFLIGENPKPFKGNKICRAVEAGEEDTKAGWLAQADRATETAGKHGEL